VAGLRRRGARRGDRLVPAPRAPLRPHQRPAPGREAGRGRLSPLAARVATAAVLIAALLGALFFLPAPWLKGLVALLIAAAAYEWARLCGVQGTLYAAALAGIFLLMKPEQGWYLLAAAFWLLIAPLWLWRGVTAGHKRILALAGVVVLLPAGLAMATLAAQQVLAVLALTWIADTAAYFAGTRWGRHKLAPSISPGKTWEGAAGGLVGVLVYAGIMAAMVEAIAWAPFLGAAALLAALSIVGDLFESAAKRQASVKDSGALLPGHGGILDRIDSATSTLPIAAALAPWIVGK
jgi:phosphatidate cytidylyltransferase